MFRDDRIPIPEEAEPMLDPVQLRSFMAVAEAGSFTAAARGLGLGQSTISQHVARLEAAAGRRLIDRDTHHLSLTADGEAMLGFARAMLAVEDRARAHFAARELHGRLRFGASEDFVTSRLGRVLESFVRDHPAIDLEITVALSGTLHRMLDDGLLDLVLAKRRLGRPRGRPVHREPLIWAARSADIADPARPLPLIAFPPPSITRAAAIDALDRAGRAWRIVCTSGSLSGLKAAADAGLGVMVQPRSMRPHGLVEVEGGPGLPALEEVEFIIEDVSVRRPPDSPEARAARILTEALVVGGIWRNG